MVHVKNRITYYLMSFIFTVLFLSLILPMPATHAAAEAVSEEPLELKSIREIDYRSHDYEYACPIHVDKTGQYVFRYGDFSNESWFYNSGYLNDIRTFLTEIDIRATLEEVDGETTTYPKDIEISPDDSLEDFEFMSLYYKKSYSFTLDLESDKSYILRIRPRNNQGRGELEMNLKQEVDKIDIAGKEVFDNIFSIDGSLGSGLGEKFETPTVVITYQDGTTEQITDWKNTDRSSSTGSSSDGDNTSYFFHYLSGIGKNIYLALQNEKGEPLLWPSRFKRPVGTCQYVVWTGNFNDTERASETKTSVQIKIPSDIPQLTTGMNENFHEISYENSEAAEHRLYSHFCPDENGTYRFAASQGSAVYLYTFDGRELSRICESYSSELIADLTQGEDYYLEIFDAGKDDCRLEIVKSDTDGYFINGITITTNPMKTTYTEGETFDPAGLVVSVICAGEDGISYKDITDYTIEPSRSLTPEDKEITVTYLKWKASIPITVNKKIAVNKKPDPEKPDTEKPDTNRPNTENSDISEQKQQIKKTKVSLKKLKSTKKKTLSITWKKAENITGYEIQICTNKKFKKSVKKYTIKKSNSTNKIIKKLKSKKRYYIRIRAYRKIQNKKYYGPWCKAKSIKIK